jgi:hypothetical protein
MARQIQVELKKVVGAEPKTPLYDDRLLDYAALYLLTGQKTFAAEAEKLSLVCVNDKELWNTPGTRG